MPRNASGTYSLVAGNPVVSGTTITSNWANTSLNDIATALTDSLDRTGDGAMLAPLKAFDGTSAAPGLAWANELGSGIYRNAAADFQFQVAAVTIQKWAATGCVFPLGLTAAAAAANNAVHGNSTGSGAGVRGTSSGTGNGGLFAAGGNNEGVNGTGAGSGAGVKGIAGATGVGVQGLGGATSGVGVSGTGGASSSAGVAGTGGATNGAGVVGTGTGSGSGVIANGGTSNGTGVVANGGATNGVGLTAIGAGNAAGLTAVSTTGWGASLTGNATSAPLHLAALAAAPGTPADGDIYYDSGTAKFYGRAGGAWVAFH